MNKVPRWMNKVPRWILAGSAASMASFQIYDKFFLEKFYIITASHDDKKYCGIVKHTGPWTSSDLYLKLPDDLSTSDIRSVKSLD